MHIESNRRYRSKRCWNLFAQFSYVRPWMIKSFSVSFALCDWFNARKMENTSIEIEIGWRFHNIFVELHVAIEVDEVRCALCAVQPQTIIISLLERYHFWLSAFRLQYVLCDITKYIFICWWKQQKRSARIGYIWSSTDTRIHLKKNKNGIERNNKATFTLSLWRACVDSRRFKSWQQQSTKNQNANA